MAETNVQRNIAEAILTRRFDLDDGHVDIYVWAPIEDGKDYARCDFQIVGLGADKMRYSAGADTIQALMGALHAINAYLYYSTDAWKDGRLTWLGMRDLGIPGLPGDRPLEGGYGQAELLTFGSWQAVVRMPDHPMPYFAMSDEHLASHIRHLKAVLAEMDTSTDEARTHLTRIVDGLLKEKHYYEAVCRQAGLPPPPESHDQ